MCFIDVSAYPVKGATTDQFQLPVLAIVLITALNDGPSPSTLKRFSDAKKKNRR